MAIYNHRGWEWYAPHDGLGSSLELVNAQLPNTYGENWGPSSTVNGTPGAANSVALVNEAPIIADVGHAPAIPKPADVVAVSARLVDEHTTAFGHGVLSECDVGFAAGLQQPADVR